MAKAEAIGKYYDKFTEGYLATYGSTIQAFRPSNLSDLHEYVIQSAGLSDGQAILDAGCGVGGPSMYFADKLDVTIQGITISQEQVNIANRRIQERSLGEKVKVGLGDFHELNTQFSENSFDRVLFLESLGHAEDSASVIKQCFSILKDEGEIYIKDFFPFEIEDEAKRERHQFVIDRINDSYFYNVLNLNKTLSALRRVGFEVLFVKKFDFVDDITARAAFEENFKIDLFGEMEEFRVAEWLEIKCRKPVNPLF